MTPDKKEHLAEFYRTWSKEKLLEAIGPQRDDYEPDAIDLQIRELRRRNIPEGEIGSAQSIPRQIPAAPSGIGGWLLFFMILMGLNSLYLMYAGLNAFLDPKNPSSFVPLLTAGIGGYGFFGLFLLITLRESAPAHAKRWIVSLFVFSVLSLLLNKIQVLAATNVIEWAIWFQYFATSKRVQATYIEQPDTNAGESIPDNHCISCESLIESGNTLCLKCTEALSK